MKVVQRCLNALKEVGISFQSVLTLSRFHSLPRAPKSRFAFFLTRSATNCSRERRMQQTALTTNFSYTKNSSSTWNVSRDKWHRWQPPRHGKRRGAARWTIRERLMRHTACETKICTRSESPPAQYASCGRLFKQRVAATKKPRDYGTSS